MSDQLPSTKPYLFRAIFDWAEDNNFTPQVLVNGLAEGVQVPRSHIIDGQIVLNVSSTAVEMHQMDNEAVSFSARFAGKPESIYLPMSSILAIFARENSQGIFFEEAGLPDPAPDDDKPKDSVSKSSAKPAEKPKSQSSHLKIVK